MEIVAELCPLQNDLRVDTGRSNAQAMPCMNGDFSQFTHTGQQQILSAELSQRSVINIVFHL
jgi:hypothetical protein